MTVYTEDISVSMPDVYVLTGANADVTLVSSSIEQATMLIETVSGVLFHAEERSTTIDTADAVWLRKAAVFQAAWLVEQVGVFSRQGVSSLSQDGLSVSAPDGMTFVLAPLAKRALNNCSWAKTGTLRVAQPTAAVLDDATVSDNHPWYPLGVA